MTRNVPEPILLCYDGSAGARHAIEWAATLFPAADAIILHLWDSPALGAIFAPSASEASTLHSRAVAIADEGAALARAGGFQARPMPAGVGVSWQSILAVADAEHARLIVTGARGVSGLRAALGSVSNGVAHHAHVPVLVVPPVSEGVSTSVFLQEEPRESSGQAAGARRGSWSAAAGAFGRTERADAIARYVLTEASKGRDLSEILNDAYIARPEDRATLQVLFDRRDFIDALGRDITTDLRVDSSRSRRADLAAPPAGPSPEGRARATPGAAFEIERVAGARVCVQADRTMRTAHGAWSATCWLTEPRRRRSKPPSPREPTTSKSAPSAA